MRLDNVVPITTSIFYDDGQIKLNVYHFIKNFTTQNKWILITRKTNSVCFKSTNRLHLRILSKPDLFRYMTRMKVLCINEKDAVKDFIHIFLKDMSVETGIDCNRNEITYELDADD